MVQMLLHGAKIYDMLLLFKILEKRHKLLLEAHKNFGQQPVKQLPTLIASKYEAIKMV
jgi:hypothetical protein